MTRAGPLLVALLALLVAMDAWAQAAKAKALPRADFFPSCPFTVVPPSVIAVLDAARWKSVLAASRANPPPYEASGTDFKHESIFIVALPYTQTPITDASLSPKHVEKFDPKTGTLTMFYDISMQQRSGDAAVAAIGQPCIITWTAARKDLTQVLTRTTDGRYIAGTRTVEKTKKKS